MDHENRINNVPWLHYHDMEWPWIFVNLEIGLLCDHKTSYLHRCCVPLPPTTNTNLLNELLFFQYHFNEPHCLLPIDRSMCLRWLCWTNNDTATKKILIATLMMIMMMIMKKSIIMRLLKTIIIVILLLWIHLYYHGHFTITSEHFTIH